MTTTDIKTDIDYRALAEWALSGDTGISSQAIAIHLGELPMYRRSGNHPHDLDDFGRCYRLLQRVPSLRIEFHRMAELGPIWAALVEAWPKIEEVYVAWLEDTKKRHARGNELIRLCDEAMMPPGAAQKLWEAELPSWIQSQKQTYRAAARELAAAITTGNPNEHPKVADLERYWAQEDAKEAAAAAQKASGESSTKKQPKTEWVHCSKCGIAMIEDDAQWDDEAGWLCDEHAWGEDYDEEDEDTEDEE